MINSVGLGAGAAEKARMEAHVKKLKALRLVCDYRQELAHIAELEDQVVMLEGRLETLAEMGRAIDDSWEEYVNQACDIVFNGERELNRAKSAIELKAAQEAVESSKSPKPSIADVVFGGAGGKPFEPFDHIRDVERLSVQTRDYFLTLLLRYNVPMHNAESISDQVMCDLVAGKIEGVRIGGEG